MSSSASRRHFLQLTGASAAAFALGELAGCPANGEGAGVGTKELTDRGDALDLVIRGGQVVTTQRRFSEDVGIEGGKITQLGGTMRGAREIDARGLLLLPGGIDPHVHVSGGWADDFESGSKAALAGGITTISNMSPPNEGQTLQQAIEQEIRIVEEQAIADVFLHSLIPNPPTEHIESIPQLVQGGTSSIEQHQDLHDRPGLRPPRLRLYRSPAYRR